MAMGKVVVQALVASKVAAQALVAQVMERKKAMAMGKVVVQALVASKIAMAAVARAMGKVAMGAVAVARAMAMETAALAMVASKVAILPRAMFQMREMFQMKAMPPMRAKPPTRLSLPTTEEREDGTEGEDPTEEEDLEIEQQQSGFYFRHQRVVYIDMRRQYPTLVACSAPQYFNFGRGASSSLTEVSECIYRFTFNNPTTGFHNIRIRGTLRTGGGDTTVTLPVAFRADNTSTGNITFTPPSGITVSSGQSLTINAAQYATEAHANYSVFCLPPTGVDSKITVTLTGDCTYQVTAGSTGGTASFNARYASTGGGANANQEYVITGAIPLTIAGPDYITFTPPAANPIVSAGRSITINAADYASVASGYTIACQAATSVDTVKISSVTLAANTCNYTASINRTAYSTTPGANNTASFTVNYTASAGSTQTGVITLAITPESNIVFTAPTGLIVARNNTLVINAANHFTENAAYVVSCANAVNVDTTRIASLSRSGCTFTVDPVDTLAANLQGETTFDVPLSSTGGSRVTATFTVNIGTDSTITQSADAPATLTRGKTVRGATRLWILDASAWVSDHDYEISCLDALLPNTSFISQATRSGCTYTLTIAGTEGSGQFVTFRFNSTGGAPTFSFSPNIVIGPDSDIAITPPTGLRVSRNRTLTIDAQQYASDNAAYTISCGEATITDAAKLASVTQDISEDGCKFTIDPIDTYTIDAIRANNNAAFTIPYTSQGGDTETATVTVEIIADTSLTFTPPAAPIIVARNFTVQIDAGKSGEYVTESAAYAVSCRDATGVDAAKITVTRSNSGDGCTFTVDPIDTLAPNLLGTTSFNVPITSASGAAVAAAFTIDIRPDSAIAFTPPTDLTVGRNRTLTIDASSYAADGSFELSCLDAIGIDTAKLASVTRPTAATDPDTCSFTVDPIDTYTIDTVDPANNIATFTVLYISSGGASDTGEVSVTIGPDSNITFTAPTGLAVARNAALAIDASPHATDNSAYAITCGDATGVDAAKMQVTRAPGTCSFTVDPIDTLPATAPPEDPTAATQGDATFSVPFTSTGGATASGTYTVNISGDSAISFTPPEDITLIVGRSRRIFAGTFASEAGHLITCSDASAVSPKFTSVTHIGSSCTFTVVVEEPAAGPADFSITYRSTSGASRQVTISVNISNLALNAPIFAVLPGQTLTVDLSEFVTDGSFDVSCSDPMGVNSAQFSSVTRIAGTCTFQAVTIARHSGPSFFRVRFTSSGGHSEEGFVNIYFAKINFTAPADLQVAANLTLEIDASEHVSDGNLAITCGDATGVDATKLASVTRSTRTENYDPNNEDHDAGCTFTVDPIDTLMGSQLGDTTFSVPFTSASGETTTGMFTVRILPRTGITISPSVPSVAIRSDRIVYIDATRFASDGDNAITCEADPTASQCYIRRSRQRNPA